MAEMISRDLAAKRIFRNNSMFADLFNAVLFDGEDVLDKNCLLEEDSESKEAVSFNSGILEISRTADNIKKVDDNGKYILLFIENQSRIDSLMPLRMRAFEDASYLKQKNTGRKGKYLPVFGIVVYSGETKWNTSKKLSDLMEMPEKWKKHFQDYEIKLVDMKEAGKWKFKERFLSELFELVKSLYEDKKDEFVRRLTENLYTDEAIISAAQLTRSEELLQRINRKKEEEHMCRNVTRWFEEEKELGIKEGIMQGEQKEKRELISIMMKKGLPLSLIAECARIQEEQLIQLIENEVMI